MLPPALLHQRLTIPSASGSIASPSDFLKAIGRASETKLSVESWDQLWRLNGLDMRKSGVAVRDRKFVVSLYIVFFEGVSEPPLVFARYILWCMEKFRAGIPIEEFAHEPPPKKTIRGYVSAQIVVFPRSYTISQMGTMCTERETDTVAAAEKQVVAMNDTHITINLICSISLLAPEFSPNSFKIISVCVINTAGSIYM